MKLKLLFFIFLSISLAADNQGDEPASMMGSGPSAFIGGVNAITGDLIEVIDIMDVKGSSPYKIQEYITKYSSKGYKFGEEARVYKHRNNRVDFTYKNPGRMKAILSPEGRGLDWGEFQLNMHLDANAGITNQGLGVSSGQTHPKNIRAFVPKKAERAELYFGDGTKKIFKKSYDALKIERVDYEFEKEFRPNGTIIDARRYKPGEGGFACYAGGKKLWGVTTGGWAKSSKEKGYRQYIFDDGRHTYLETVCFDEGKASSWSDWDQVWYPTKVTSQTNPEIFYTWISINGGKGALLRSKKRADDRERLFCYYGQDRINPGRARDKNKVKSIFDVAVNTRKVKSRKSIQRYHFNYETKCTIVTDANRHTTKFFYDDDKCLIRKSWGNIHEIFTWGKKDSLKGSLLEDKFSVGLKEVFKTCYGYDTFGNVTTLTSKGSVTAPRSRDDHIIRSTYSTEGMNLLTSKTEGTKTTKYHYKPGTNLLIAQFVCTAEGIVERSFYDYNEQCALVLEINDDGTSEHRESLEGVSSRLIKRIKQNLIGYPQEVFEGYVDLDSGKEVQLKRIEYQTTRDGWITKETIYDGNDQLVCVVEKEYDKFGRIIHETDALGQKKSHSYLTSGVCTKTVLEGKGVEKSFIYDHADRLLAESVGGYVNKYEYDNMDNRVVSEDMFDNKVKCQYDGFGRVVGETLPQILTKDGAAYPLKSKGYDLFGNVTSETDARGFTTRTEYNIFGKPFTVNYPDGSCEEYRYNLDGTLKEQTLRNRSKMLFTYDALGRKISEKLYSSSGELLKNEEYIFDRVRLREKVDCEGISTLYEYDFAGRLIKELRGSQRQEYGYDNLGRRYLTKVWYGDGDHDYTVHIEIRDLLDQVLEKREEGADGILLSQIQYRYDQNGNVTHEIVGDAITETRFDALDRPIEIVSPEGLVTHIEYQKIKNTLGQFVLQKVTTAPSGTLTLEEHDALGRVVAIEKISNLGETLSKARLYFDVDGNLEEQIHEALSEGVTLHTSKVQWEYNSMNQLLLLVESAGTPLQRTTHTSYTFYGEKESVIKPDGTTLHFEYDDRGLLAKHYSSGAAQNISYSYTYDVADRLTQVIDLLTGEVTKRSYDSYGNMVNETLASGIEIDAAYDFQGRLSKVDFGNQMGVQYQYGAAYLRAIHCTVRGKEYVTTYDTYDLSGRALKRTLPAYCGELKHQYDLEGRLLSVDHKRWSESGLEYDLDGNLIAKQLSIEGAESEVAYAYDALGQLTEEPSHSYSYDSLHNRLSKDDTPYSSNSLNEIVSAGTEQFVYDPCGNLIQRGETHYYYDALDRLVKAETPEQTVTLTYDSFGRRLSRTGMKKGWFEEYESTSLYYYHGDHEVGSQRDGELEDFRFLGNGLGGEIGATVLMWHRGYVTIPLHDLSGNVRALLKSQGTLKTTYDYTAFGECEPSSFPNQWLFSSKRYDPVLNLYNFGLRYYAPDLGRWITTDPKSYQEGPNLYAYVLNRPLTLIDPFGAAAVSCFEFEKYMNNNSLLKATRLALPLSGTTAQEINNQNGSSISELGYHENPDFFIGFINGICNSFDDCKSHAERISEHAGGYNVHFVHNESHGGCIDIVECGMGKLKVATEPAKLVQKMWDGFFKNASPKGMVLQYCHSQGAIHVMNALLTYPKEYRERIIVIPVAPATYIDQSLCRSVRHCKVPAHRDIVPNLAPVSYYRYGKNTTTVVPSLERGVDHSFSSDSYQDFIYRVVTSFLSGSFDF